MRFTRFASITATALLALAVLAGIPAPEASAAATLQGAVSFTDGGGAATSGGSGTVTMKVPTGAACQGPGSSGYRWETYLVSVGVDVAALTFSSSPNPVSGQFVVPLFDLNLLQVSTKFPAASPLGLISGIPAISLSNTIDGNGLLGLPLGTYKIGIACTYQGAIQEYWMTYLEVTADVDDVPLGIAWTVTTEPVPTTTSTTSTSTTTTSTTAPGGTTTTSPASSTSTTVLLGGGATTSTVFNGSGGYVPAAGSSSTRLVVLALVALVLGRMVLLSARRVKVLPSA